MAALSAARTPKKERIVMTGSLIEKMEIAMLALIGVLVATAPLLMR
jgi:hypothetical protein